MITINLKDASVVILRRIYPTQHPCPGCKCLVHKPGVRSHSRGDSFVYRKCANPSCGMSYRVPLLAVEVENPDCTTRIDSIR